jgi:hypothetical protein
VSSPIRVAVTGAAGFIAYSLLPFIAAGDAFVSEAAEWWMGRTQS